MEINSNNLINKDILQTNKFENTKSSTLVNRDEKQLKNIIIVLSVSSHSLISVSEGKIPLYRL